MVSSLTNFIINDKHYFQRAKTVLSDSPGLVDFAIRLLNSVFNLPDGQVMFYEEFEQKNKTFLGLVEMTSGLVNASFSLPKGQAVKMIFFAHWFLNNNMTEYCKIAS